jgi:hypothetical protein
MGGQAIDQNIFPRYWERPKCSIAQCKKKCVSVQILEN